MFGQSLDHINMWYLPPLADPGPRKLAIQLALLSSLNCLSNLPATSRLRAASLAWGDITPIREIRHWACALTMQVLSNLLYWLTITLSCPSSSGLPVERQMCSTLLSACADLNQVVEIFAAVSPGPSDETHQVSKALEPCHKCARLARCCAPHLLVQPLQRAAICPWQFSCSTVSLLFCSPRRITRDPGGHHF